jgi:hypothetical protein
MKSGTAANPLAQRNLRAMRPGEPVLYYHTGTERSVVAVAEVAGPPHPDPGDDRGAWAVRIRAVRRLRAPVPLDRLKSDPEFSASPLVRIGRLSVVEITERQWDRILAFEAGRGGSPGRFPLTPRTRRAARDDARPDRRTGGQRRPRPPTGSSAGGRSPAKGRRSGTGG